MTFSSYLIHIALLEVDQNFIPRKCKEREGKLENNIMFEFSDGCGIKCDDDK